jgi:hypothetical protein
MCISVCGLSLLIQAFKTLAARKILPHIQFDWTAYSHSGFRPLFLIECICTYYFFTVVLFHYYTILYYIARRSGDSRTYPPLTTLFCSIFYFRFVFFLNLSSLEHYCYSFFFFLLLFYVVMSPDSISLCIRSFV